MKKQDLKQAKELYAEIKKQIDDWNNKIREIKAPMGLIVGVAVADDVNNDVASVGTIAVGSKFKIAEIVSQMRKPPFWVKASDIADIADGKVNKDGINELIKSIIK